MKENERQLDVFRFHVRARFNDLTHLISSPRFTYQTHYLFCERIFCACCAMINLAFSLEIIDECEYSSLFHELHDIYDKALHAGAELPDIYGGNIR